MPKQTACLRALVFIGMVSLALTRFQEISVAQNTSGLTASPNPVNLTIPFPLDGGGSTVCTNNPSPVGLVFINYNGAPVYNGGTGTVTGASSSTGRNPNWLQPVCLTSSNGVSAGLNLTGLSPGNYAGILTIVTTAGSIDVPFNQA